MDHGISKTLKAGRYFLSPQDVYLSGWTQGLSHKERLLLATRLHGIWQNGSEGARGKLAF